MKTKSYRAIALVSAFLFILPIATTYCCCTQMPSVEVGHSRVGQHQDHCHHDSQSGSTHDHSECQHPQLGNGILAQDTQFFSFLSANQKLNIEVSHASASNGHISLCSKTKFVNGIGPPGRFSANSPLYLQISVLRI